MEEGPRRAAAAYAWHMVSTDLLASVDALSDAERIELLAYIEGTLGPDAAPTAEQQAIAERRLGAMRTDPSIGLTVDEAVKAARRLTA